MIKKRMTTIDKHMMTLAAMTKKPLTEEQFNFLKFLLFNEEFKWFLTEEYHEKYREVVYGLDELLKVTKQDYQENFWKLFKKLFSDLKKVRILVKSKSIRIIDKCVTWDCRIVEEGSHWVEFHIFYNQQFLDLWLRSTCAKN
jgi:hypothetical protein